MNDAMMIKIQDMLDAYVYAYDDYVRSQTCCNITYKQQKQDMYDTRYALLNFIRENLPK